VIATTTVVSQSGRVEILILRLAAALLALSLAAPARGAEPDAGRKDFAARCAALCAGEGLGTPPCALYCECLAGDLARYLPPSDWGDLRAALAAAPGAPAPARERARLAKSRERCQGHLTPAY
jgi:hypothetical protein